MKGRNPQRGKGPAAPGGQAGRARAGGGPALQAWARGDSYSDTGSAAAVAVAAGFSAAARPARDPRPGPSPCAPTCHRPPARPGLWEAAPLGPTPPPTPEKAQEEEGRRRDFPGPPPGPAPTCPGGVRARNFPGQRKKDAPRIKAVLARSHFSMLTQGVPHSPPTLRPCPTHTAPAAPVSLARPQPRPQPPPPAKFGPELTGPRAGRALGQRAGSRGRGAGVGVACGAGRPRGWGRRAARARSACGAARARGARSAGPPARPRRRPDNAPLGRTHGARRRRHRPGHAHQVSAPGPRPPKHRGALKGDAARPRPDGRGQSVGAGPDSGGRGQADRHRPGSTAPPDCSPLDARPRAPVSHEGSGGLLPQG